MDLGDMYISLAYVDRQISRDREEGAAAAAAAAAAATAAAETGAEDARAAGAQAKERGGAGEEDREWWDGERGVSGAMSTVFDVQVCTCMESSHSSS